MKKRIPVFLLIAAFVYLIVFAFFYKSTRDLSKSLEYSAILTGALAFIMIFAPPDVTRAQINSVRFETDVGTGGIIDKLAEQNRHLEEQNRILKEQKSKSKDNNTEDDNAFRKRY